MVVGYQRSFMKFYKASANVNLNWSKFNSLRANPLIRNPLIDFIQTTDRLLKAIEDHLGRSLKFGQT
jgi:hypothetical protein